MARGKGVIDIRWWGLALLLAALACGAHATPLEFTVPPSCDLHQGPCRASAHNGWSVELAISPEEIPLLQPLDISVTLQGMLAETVQVVFSGVDVDMGTLAYPLQAQGGSHFHGEASLSICIQRRMRWQATVVVAVQGQNYRIPFLFTTEYRPRFKLL